MLNELTVYFDNFGFAAVRVLLRFYVLCSKEALARLKPISLLMARGACRRRRRKSVRLAVDRWDETIYSSLTFSAPE